MKIALTVWGNRISPVFDSAQTLLIVRIENNKVIEKSYESISADRLYFSNKLRELGISVLICGAISKVATDTLASSKIKLIPFITGNSAQVIELYLSDEPVSLSYFMPGYKPQGCINGLKNVVLNV